MWGRRGRRGVLSRRRFCAKIELKRRYLGTGSSLGQNRAVDIGSAEETRAEVGDLVVIFQSGAYGPSASPAAFLGHPAPQEVLV